MSFVCENSPRVAPRTPGPGQDAAPAVETRRRRALALPAPVARPCDLGARREGAARRSGGPTWSCTRQHSGRRDSPGAWPGPARPPRHRRGPAQTAGDVPAGRVDGGREGSASARGGPVGRGSPVMRPPVGDRLFGPGRMLRIRRAGKGVGERNRRFARCSPAAGRVVRPTAHCPLPTAHCPLPTAHCPLPTAHCPLPTAHCPLPTARRAVAIGQPARKPGRVAARRRPARGRRGDRETGRQGDRETGRQGDRETGRQGDRETGRQGDRETGRQSVILAAVQGQTGAVAGGDASVAARARGAGPAPCRLCQRPRGADVSGAPQAVWPAGGRSRGACRKRGGASAAASVSGPGPTGTAPGGAVVRRPGAAP